eukprot:TRINITY_DN16785_c0_g4_i3.p1 TRINITY_DN16785_c0_g4~~TRINITY_DN16785_c0_g4_i3.p1  ORF type:complete len:1756 (+),score=481.58 TRINITY_DN16785_c0_g4_i3:92-5269(+)
MEWSLYGPYPEVGAAAAARGSSWLEWNAVWQRAWGLPDATAAEAAKRCAALEQTLSDFAAHCSEVVSAELRHGRFTGDDDDDQSEDCAARGIALVPVNSTARADRLFGGDLDAARAQAAREVTALSCALAEWDAPGRREGALCPPLCCAVTAGAARFWCHAPLPWGAGGSGSTQQRRPFADVDAAVLVSDPIPPAAPLQGSSGLPCIASFPGRYAVGWNRGGPPRRGPSACVWLRKGDADGLYGRHAATGPGQCLCTRIYGDRPEWGCAWFAEWKSNIERAVQLGMRLRVYFFKGEVGQGKLRWDDLPVDDLWGTPTQPAVGLGGSQRVEVAWLDSQHIPYDELDVSELVGEEAAREPRRRLPASLRPADTVLRGPQQVDGRWCAAQRGLVCGAALRRFIEPLSATGVPWESVAHAGQPCGSGLMCGPADLRVVWAQRDNRTYALDLARFLPNEPPDGEPPPRIASSVKPGCTQQSQRAEPPGSLVRLLRPELLKRFGQRSMPPEAFGPLANHLHPPGRELDTVQGPAWELAGELPQAAAQCAQDLSQLARGSESRLEGGEVIAMAHARGLSARHLGAVLEALRRGVPLGGRGPRSHVLVRSRSAEFHVEVEIAARAFRSIYWERLLREGDGCGPAAEAAAVRQLRLLLDTTAESDSFWQLEMNPRMQAKFGAAARPPHTHHTTPVLPTRVLGRPEDDAELARARGDKETEVARRLARCGVVCLPLMRRAEALCGLRVSTVADEELSVAFDAVVKRPRATAPEWLQLAAAGDFAEAERLLRAAAPAGRPLPVSLAAHYEGLARLYHWADRPQEELAAARRAVTLRRTDETLRAPESILLRARGMALCAAAEERAGLPIDSADSARLALAEAQEAASAAVACGASQPEAAHATAGVLCILAEIPGGSAAARYRSLAAARDAVEVTPDRRLPRMLCVLGELQLAMGREMGCAQCHRQQAVVTCSDCAPDGERRARAPKPTPTSPGSMSGDSLGEAQPGLQRVRTAVRMRGGGQQDAGVQRVAAVARPSPAAAAKGSPAAARRGRVKAAHGMSDTLAGLPLCTACAQATHRNFAGVHAHHPAPVTAGALSLYDRAAALLRSCLFDSYPGDDSLSWALLHSGYLRGDAVVMSGALSELERAFAARAQRATELVKWQLRCSELMLKHNDAPGATATLFAVLPTLVDRSAVVAAAGGAAGGAPEGERRAPRGAQRATGKRLSNSSLHHRGSRSASLCPDSPHHPPAAPDPAEAAQLPHPAHPRRSSATPSQQQQSQAGSLPCSPASSPERDRDREPSGTGALARQPEAFADLRLAASLLMRAAAWFGEHARTEAQLTLLEALLRALGCPAPVRSVGPLRSQLAEIDPPALPQYGVPRVALRVGLPQGALDPQLVPNALRALSEAHIAGCPQLRDGGTAAGSGPRGGPLAAEAAREAAAALAAAADTAVEAVRQAAARALPRRELDALAGVLITALPRLRATGVRRAWGHAQAVTDAVDAAFAQAGYGGWGHREAAREEARRRQEEAATLAGRLQQRLQRGARELAIAAARLRLHGVDGVARDIYTANLKRRVTQLRMAALRSPGQTPDPLVRRAAQQVLRAYDSAFGTVTLLPDPPDTSDKQQCDDTLSPVARRGMPSIAHFLRPRAELPDFELLRRRKGDEAAAAEAHLRACSQRAAWAQRLGIPPGVGPPRAPGWVPPALQAVENAAAARGLLSASGCGPLPQPPLGAI